MTKNDVNVFEFEFTCFNVVWIMQPVCDKLAVKKAPKSLTLLSRTITINNFLLSEFLKGCEIHSFFFVLGKIIFSTAVFSIYWCFLSKIFTKFSTYSVFQIAVWKFDKYTLSPLTNSSFIIWQKSFISYNLFYFSIFSWKKPKMSAKDGGDGAQHEFVKEPDSKTESNFFIDLLKVFSTF